MREFNLLLDLKCIELRIIQLSNLSSHSIREQLCSLSAVERRYASRKIKKLTKKAINEFAHNSDHKSRMLCNCGFSQANPRKSSALKVYQRRRLELVRRLLVRELDESMNSEVA